MLKKLGQWIYDYLYLVRGQVYPFIFQKPPSHYLGHIIESNRPIILIPGVYSKWHFLKAIADPLSLKGHPVYVLEKLGYNKKDIQYSARLVRELIDEKGLQNVILIAHSKGGLIGKFVLAFYNKDQRVKKLIAIATPFGGSTLAKFIPHRIVNLSPISESIKILQGHKEVNNKIVSIFGVWDNHVWPTLSCFLEGAKNIQVEVSGHHKILFAKKVKEIILAEVEKT